MFPLTHLYIAEKTAGRTPKVLLGSILLDAPVTSKYLTYENFEKCDWLDKIKDPYLKKGLIIHMAVDEISHRPHGKNNVYPFRWFTDRFPGVSNWRWHIVPEYMIELNIVETYPYVLDLFEIAATADINSVAHEIANAIGKNEKMVYGAIKRYIGLVREYNKLLTKNLPNLINNGMKDCLEECINNSNLSLKEYNLKD